MDAKTMFESFGVADQTGLLKVKQTERQTRIFSIKKPSAVALTADECKKLCDGIGVKYAPGYEGRVMQYVVSNESVDRYGDIVRAKGVQFTNYMNNPVIHFAHNYSTPPVGNSLKAWCDKQAKCVMAWGLFLDDSVDTTGLADLVFRMASSGFMRACSIGFMPIKVNYPQSKEEREALGLGQYGVEYTESDMLEWSPCGVPANPAALQNAMKDIGTRLSLEQRHVDAAAKYNLFGDYNLLDKFVESLKEKGVVVDVGVHVAVTEDPEDPEEPATQAAAQPLPVVEPVAQSYIALTQEQYDALTAKQPINITVQLDTKDLSETVVTVRELAAQIKSVAELILKKDTASQTKRGLYEEPAPAPAVPLLGRPNL